MRDLIKLGVSGDMGSFSEEAGLAYATRNKLNTHLEYLIDMENVLVAVKSKTVDLGIFPVVNLQGGLVRMAFDAMGKHNFTVVDELWLTVNQCLLVKPGVLTHDITTIISHSQALAQCKEYLQKHYKEIPLLEWQDTAKAARDLAEGKLDSNTAVIAPLQAATLYNLEVIAKNIQDVNPNLTAFIVVKTHEEKPHENA